MSLVDGARLSNAKIYCPVDSPYRGNKDAPCMIYATDGTIKDTHFYAPEGIPKNIWIDMYTTADGGTSFNVWIHCTATDRVNGDWQDGSSQGPFSRASSCWYVFVRICTCSMLFIFAKGGRGTRQQIQLKIRPLIQPSIRR